MEDQKIISEVATVMKSKFNDESSGHDWWHIYRVWQTAKHIAETEGGNLFVIEVAALLHDIADWKFNNGNEHAGGKAARELLSEWPVEETLIDRVVQIIDRVSYKGADVIDAMNSLEGKIVQDADRLDAIGAIGIARTFAYGGHKGRAIYDPSIKPVRHASFEAYKNNCAPTINHFYEKLLLLKNRMHTATGKQMAEERHRFMELYLNQFFEEWEGRK